jgi:hypothetical protein
LGLKDVELDSSGLELGSIAGFCKHDHEFPETLTGGDFLRSEAAYGTGAVLQKSQVDLTTIRANLMTFVKITMHTSLQLREHSYSGSTEVATQPLH